MAQINGDAGRNMLKGTNAKDVIKGFGGDDTIYGYGGNDVINAGAGQDIVYGGDGYDSIHGGADSDKILGGDGNDQLFGDGGADILSGGAGRDILVGGSGSNQLWGDGGADTFKFLSSTADDVGPGDPVMDQILDFSRAQNDVIDVSTIDANTRVAGNQAFKWLGGAEFTGTPGEARYDYYADFGGTGREVAFVKFDVNGDSTADLSIWIEKPPAHILNAGDFIL